MRSRSISLSTLATSRTWLNMSSLQLKLPAHLTGSHQEQELAL